MMRLCDVRVTGNVPFPTQIGVRTFDRVGNVAVEENSATVGVLRLAGDMRVG
jgi:hypothetical protein